MPHEYLFSAYSFTNEVIGVLQFFVMVSFQEDCSAMNHTHGITIITINVTFPSKTEVTQMIHRIMYCGYAIPICY